MSFFLPPLPSTLAEKKDKMTVYQAIEQMRQLSERGVPFSMVYMTYSEEDGTSHGIREVRSATLHKQSTKEQNRNHDIMLNYYDSYANKYGRCYQPLLMEFNGQKLELT